MSGEQPRSSVISGDAPLLSNIFTHFGRSRHDARKSNVRPAKKSRPWWTMPGSSRSAYVYVEQSFRCMRNQSAQTSLSRFDFEGFFLALQSVAQGAPGGPRTGLRVRRPFFFGSARPRNLATPLLRSCVTCVWRGLFHRWR